MINLKIVSFTDTTSTHGSFRAAVEAAFSRVADLITANIKSPGASIDVAVTIKDVGSAAGDGGSAYIFDQNNPKHPINITATEIKSGADLNGVIKDSVLDISPNFIDSFKGDYSLQKNADVIASFVMHETLHAIGFDGFIDTNSGVISSQYYSDYDAHVVINNGAGSIEFSGENVNFLLGSTAQLESFGSSGIYHLKKGSIDVMAPGSIGFEMSDLDLAILKDIGVTTRKTLVSSDKHHYIVGSDAAVITGAAGAANTVKFDGTRNDFTVQTSVNSALVSLKADPSSSYTMNNTAHLQFNDVSVNLGIQSNAASISPAQLKTIVDLYIAFFNRIPDADGLDYWITASRNGTTINSIADNFYAAGVQSAQLTGYSNTATNSDFVKTVYKNALQRTTVDAEGLNYWTNSLNNGSETRGTLVTQILAAAHTSTNTSFGDFSYVAKLLDNKYTVAVISAVQQGLTDISPETAIMHGMAIASAVTSTDMTAAIKLIGVTDAHFGV